MDPIQGGAGTSANMNINEVVANRAIEILGGEKGNYDIVNPNDHVNMCQSTNDVFPTAGKITAIKMIHQVILQLESKINPVIPEVVSQVAFNVIVNDLTITMAAEAGQLELNAFEPILFYNLFESLETLSHAISTLVDNCIIGITANEDHCLELLEESVGIATALCPYIGYKKSAEIAKSSLKTGIPIRKLVLKNGILTKEKLDSILNPDAMTNPKYISAS